MTSVSGCMMGRVGAGAGARLHVTRGGDERCRYMKCLSGRGSAKCPWNWRTCEYVAFGGYLECSHVGAGARLYVGCCSFDALLYIPSRCRPKFTKEYSTSCFFLSVKIALPSLYSPLRSLQSYASSIVVSVLYIILHRHMGIGVGQSSTPSAPSSAPSSAGGGATPCSTTPRSSHCTSDLSANAIAHDHGLTPVHFSAQLDRYLLYGGRVWGLFRRFRGVSKGAQGYSGFRRCI